MYTLKAQQIAVKDPDTGTYVGLDVLTEQTAAGVLNQIETLGNTKKQAITSEANAQTTAITNLGDSKKQAITSEANAQTTAITTLGDNKKQAISSEAALRMNEITNQKNSIVSLANTKKQEITDEGAAQVRAVNSKGQEVLASIPNNYSDLTDLVDRAVNAGFIYGTANGEIANFDDGADNVPIKSLVSTITSSQDFNGYDHQWPAGGGKNLLPYPTTTPNVGSTYTSYGVTMTRNADGSLSFTGTATADAYFYFNTYKTDHSGDFTFPAGDYILSSEITGAAGNSYRLQLSVYVSGELTRSYADVGSGASVKVNAGETEAVYLFVPKNKNMNGNTIKPMLRLASNTNATFEPYSNICSITGRTALTGKRTGGNLADVNNFYYSGNGTTVTKESKTGTLVIKNTSGTRYCGTNAWFTGLLNNKPFPAGKYTMSFDISGTITTTWMAGTRAVSNDTFDATEKVSFSSPGHYSFTFDSSLWTYDKYLSVSRIGNQTSNVDVTISNLTIVKGEAEGVFEPYVSKTLSVDLTSSAGPVYGGTVDLISGKMVINYGKMVVDGNGSIYSISARTNTVRCSVVANPIMAGDVRVAIPVISDALVPVTGTTLTIYNSDILGVCGWRDNATNNPGLWLSIPSSAGSTQASIQAWLNANPITCIYPIASTSEIQLTPQEVSTLLGGNNIWINGETVSVTYPIDTKTYIDRKIRDTVEEMLGA